MTLRTYHAYTMAEALAAAKSDLGADAVILHTRSFKRGGWFGLFRRTVIELTATPAAAQPAAKQAPGISSKVKLKAVEAQRAYDAAKVATKSGNSPERPSQASAPRTSRAPSDSDVERHRTQRLAMALEEASSRKSTLAPPATITEAKPAAPPRRHVLTAAPPPAPGRAARRFILTSPDQAKKTGEITVTSNALPIDRKEDNAKIEARVLAVASTAPSSSVNQMHDELHAIKSMVGQVLQRQAGSSNSQSPMMPQQLFDLYLKLIAQDISTELADQIVHEVRTAHSDEELAESHVVQAAVRQRLAEFIPVSGEHLPYSPADGRPLIIAMVGPTGVGKTTTLAKLAATFKLNHGKSVGLITADTYRIAAVDQLRTYADILGLPMHVALTPAEMKRSVQAMSDREVILIDTAGRSQRDVSRLSELKRFIAAANPHEVHLVLASTAGEKVLLQEAEAFSEVGVHKIVLTKLDEAVTFGVLVNAVRQIGKQLSYVTTGQEVPDHIEVGSGVRLASLVLGETSTLQPATVSVVARSAAAT